MKTIFSKFFSLFSKNNPVKVALSMSERKDAGDAAITRGLLRSHGDRGQETVKKVFRAEELRAQLTDSFIELSESKMKEVESLIRCFERTGT